ncbi:RepB family plasmid replication initiator protein [Agrobacterium sp. 22094]|uniref:RepB family plasmid replication initiator protein n=1 Tax=Agrobacterium sp. 22094 TaxID=3453872 RepID=UPI003F8502A6
MTAAVFSPAPQGSIQTALAAPGQLRKIAPASPRPVELLGSLTVVGGSDLTAKDAALSELLIAMAYESDRGMNTETMSIPMKSVIRYLGADTRREHVKASLNRLKSTFVSFTVGGTSYEDVALLQSWIRRSDTEDAVFYSLPEPIRAVMSDRARYAYVELAALPMMSSTYSSRVYRRLVAAIAESGRKWTADGDNVLTIDVTPQQVADWVGYPRSRDGGLHVGKLRERVLAGLQKDFAAVTAFGFSMTTHAGSGRGRPLERVSFRLELAAPSRFRTRITYTPEDMRYIGGQDVADLSVESSLWIKAARQFQSAETSLSHRAWYDLWLAAVQEMQTGVPLSRECDERVFRGEGLRSKIDSIGANEAAWGFVAEEFAEPDLSLRSDIRELGAAGRAARHDRIAPVAEPDTEKSVAMDGRISFDAASEIIVDVDPSLTIREQTELVFRPIKNHEWSGVGNGGASKILRVRYLDDGQLEEWELTKTMSEDDVVSLMSSIGPHLVGNLEYVA